MADFFENKAGSKNAQQILKKYNEIVGSLQNWNNIYIWINLPWGSQTLKLKINLGMNATRNLMK